MTKVIDFTNGVSSIPDYFLDALQEFLSGAHLNFKIEQVNSTTIKVPGAAGSGKSSIAMTNPANTAIGWRYRETDITAAHPGGGAGTYDIYVTGSANAFTGTPPNIDVTTYNFGLVIKASGSTPSGSGSEALYRKVGTLTWDGTAITGITPLIAQPASAIVVANINQAGLLSARPAATAVVAGTKFFATDQVAEYISDGAIWRRIGPPAGVVSMFFGNAAPTGYVLYDGTALPASTGIYADLYAQQGNSTATPNMKKRIPIGRDSSSLPFDTIGETGGAETHAITTNELPAVIHWPSAMNGGNPGGSPSNFWTGDGGAGGGVAMNLMNPYIVVNFIAKL